MCVRMGRWAKGLGHVYEIKSRRLRSAPSSMSRCQRSERLPHASSPAPTSICQGRPNGQDSSASKGVGPHGHTSPAPARPQAKPNCHARELMPHRAVLTHPTRHVKIFYTRTTHAIFDGHQPSQTAVRASHAKPSCQLYHQPCHCCQCCARSNAKATQDPMFSPFANGHAARRPDARKLHRAVRMAAHSRE
jgi:hypothetical protein